MANVAAYTISILFDFIRKNCRGFELDFMRIWNAQEIYPELRKQIEYLCTQVYKYITRSDRPQENVTQWCKSELCWTRAQAEKWPILEAFIKTLVPASEVKEVEKDAKEQRKVNNEVDDLKFIMAQGAGYWQKVLNWGSSAGKLSDMEKSILQLLANMEVTGRMPSVKQAKVAIKSREKLIGEGMPLQF